MSSAGGSTSERPQGTERRSRSSLPSGDIATSASPVLDFASGVEPPASSGGAAGSAPGAPASAASGGGVSAGLRRRPPAPRVVEEDPAPAAEAAAESAAINPFLKSLKSMLSDAGSCVTWGADDATLLVYSRRPVFTAAVLPKYFKHNQYNSFVRQLNIYGFRKIDDDGAPAMGHALAKRLCMSGGRSAVQRSARRACLLRARLLHSATLATHPHARQWQPRVQAPPLHAPHDW